MIISSPVSIDVQNGLYAVYGLYYGYNVGLNNATYVDTGSGTDNNGQTYTLPQTCGSDVYFQFQAVGVNGDFLTDFEITLTDTATGTIRTAYTNSEGIVYFQFETGCHTFNIGYTLNFTISALMISPNGSYVSPTIVVNVD